MSYSVALRVAFFISDLICLNTSLTLFQSAADERRESMTVDHYVSVRSTVPFLAGFFKSLRSIVRGAGFRARHGFFGPHSVNDRVVLFIHGGAGTTARGWRSDVTYQDYSWMGVYFRSGGLSNVFAMALPTG